MGNSFAINFVQFFKRKSLSYKNKDFTLIMMPPRSIKAIKVSQFRNFPLKADGAAQINLLPAQGQPHCS